jgi:hypothetical protein
MKKLNFVYHFNPNIKFTCDFNFATRSMEFLYLKIWVDSEGYIQTDIYIKDNAKNTYLLPVSNHPSHCCKNIPYSLAFRVLRNCSQEEQREARFEELSDKMVKRGYRKKLVSNAIENVKELKREQVLQKVQRADSQGNRVRAIFRYDKRLPNLSSIFKRDWQTMVDDDQRLLEVYPDPPMVCFRRGRNVRETLCQAKLPPARISRHEDGFRRCKKAQCRLCPYTNLRPGEVLKSIKISSTGVELPISGQLTCQSSNLLYIGSCAKGDRTCPDRPQYCGETGKTAEERFVGHRNSIVQACQAATSLPVGEHFRSAGHSVTDFVFTPVEKISGGVFIRKAGEKRLINKLNLIDSGLNRKL